MRVRRKHQSPSPASRLSHSMPKVLQKEGASSPGISEEAKASQHPSSSNSSTSGKHRQPYDSAPLRRVSKPGLRSSKNTRQLRRVPGWPWVWRFISTSRVVMSDSTPVKQGVGVKCSCYIYG